MSDLRAPSTGSTAALAAACGRRLRAIAHTAAHRPSLLLILIIAVGAFDLWLTWRALELGWLIELNPFAARVISRYGVAGLAVYRTAVTSAGSVLLYWALCRYAREGAQSRVAQRVHTVVALGVVVLVTTHVSLVLYWAAWLIA